MIKAVQLWKKESRKKMSLQEYFKSKEKLKETIKKIQIKDERAGASKFQ